MHSRPVVVAFDVIETLMSLEPLRDRITALGLPPHLLELWFTRTLRDGMALAASGTYAPFPDVAAQALRVVTGDKLGGREIGQVMAGFGELPAHPDAAPAFGLLTGAGVRVACLTNGSQQVTASFLERNGLAEHVERIISVDEVRSWKPPAKVYQHAAAVLGVSPGQAALVAAHAWDCHGAKCAGLAAGWVSRLELVYSPVFTAPDVTGGNLVEVAAGLLRR